MLNVHKPFLLLAIASASVVVLDCVAVSVRAAPNSVDFALYFDSEIHDAAECAMSANGDAVMIDKKVVNPSISCPDMFSWKLCVDVVRQGWWINWASDE
jgi:hypothetical protein